MVWEAISNIRKCVSSDIQTPWSWLKNTRLRLIFSTSSQCWISDETLFLVFDILRDLRETASVLILSWSISQHSQDDLASSSSSPVPSPISVESPASQRSPRASPFILDVDSVISERHQVRDLFFLSWRWSSGIFDPLIATESRIILYISVIFIWRMQFKS